MGAKWRVAKKLRFKISRCNKKCGCSAGIFWKSRKISQIGWVAKTAKTMWEQNDEELIASISISN